MLILEDLKYTEEHMWARREGSKKVITVGLTEHGMKGFGNIIYIELPEEGEQVIKDEPFGSIESSESVTDMYAPVSGKVVQVNEELMDSPEIAREDPYEDGWLVRIVVPSLKEYNELMTPDEYKEYIREKELEEGEEEDDEEEEEEE